MVRVALVISLAALMVACDRSSVADKPLTFVGPSGAIAAISDGVSTAGALTTRGRQDIVVNIQGACDADTFNEALQNPEACDRAGGVKFDPSRLMTSFQREERIAKRLTTPGS